MTKWEYIVVADGASWPDKGLLDRMGADGWELVAVTLGRAYFKRPLHDDGFKEF